MYKWTIIPPLGFLTGIGCGSLFRGEFAMGIFIILMASCLAYTLIMLNKQERG